MLLAMPSMSIKFIQFFFCESTIFVFIRICIQILYNVYNCTQHFPDDALLFQELKEILFISNTVCKLNPLLSEVRS